MTEEYKPKEYIPTIDAILSVSDLEKVSVKKIRGALQELFSVDLTEHKKHINEVILERYHSMSDSREEENEKNKREEMIKQDALLALQLLKESRRRGQSLPATIKKKVAKPKPKAPKDPNAKRGTFGKPVRTSNELYDVIGIEKDFRAQIVKALWAYIKANDLQDPSNKRQILCDEKLERLFKKKKVDSFGMQKDLTHHIFKDEDITPESQTMTVPNSAIPPPPVSEIESSQSEEE